MRWRTNGLHHEMQQKGREGVEQRLDETETGEATTVTLIDATRPAETAENAAPEQLARRLGLRPGAPGLVGWDVFDRC